jgi:carboxylesterase type B
MGESAGAMSVDIQLNNPWSLGYYKGAILMSGAGKFKADRQTAEA